jgi:hypothetical protein
MNAIDRACVNAGRVFGADARFRDDVGHRGLFSFPGSDTTSVAHEARSVCPILPLFRRANYSNPNGGDASQCSLYIRRAAAYDEPVKRLLPPALFLGLLVALQLAIGQVNISNPRTPKSQVDDRLPDGSSRTMAMVKNDQERSLEDIAKIREAADEMEKELSKSEFLVSLTALKRAEEIEELAKDIQNRLKRRR